MVKFLIKKKKRHNIEATSFFIKMNPKNEKWPKISTNIAIFYQKRTFMKEFLNFQGLGKLWEVKNWIWDSFLS